MTTKKLTQEQYEKLTPYKENLINAYKHSFVRMPGTDFIKVAEIYNEVFGTPLTKSQMGCNTCRLNTLRKLGELYANYVPPKKPDVDMKDGTITVNLDNYEQPKKETKRGRPKKLKEE